MRLKKLEMCGFKSFANRTEVAFDHGVTGIVGPNGCGKSNVVDAIKWVLGTLSYKSVRGEEMLDVIFKGAEGIPQMGFAEVSLTLDNADHTLPLEFEDVTIKRRLASTGEGEYYINGAACRLKDIRELLYGTGIGTDNYSLIEQGKISRLVESNPHERRLVFDEAAGISKYRAKRRETENRLEKVSQDLLRIQDRSQEIQKQLRSVRQQAARASRYKELLEELKGKRLRVFIHEHRALGTRLAEIGGRLASLEERRAQLRADLEARAAALEASRKGLEEQTARHAELSSVLASLEAQGAFLQQARGTAQKRCEEIESERRRVEGELEALRAKLAEVEASVAAEEGRRASLDEEVRARAAESDEIRSRLEDAARECDRVGSELETRRAEAVELAHKEAECGNERERLGRDAAGLKARAAQAGEQAGKIEIEIEGLREKIAAERAAAAALEQEVAGLLERKRAGESDQERLREERGRLEREMAQLREGRSHRVARQETLRDLEAQLQGLETGARTLLRERPEGLLGTLADFVTVAPEHVAAVEAGLGERAGAIVFGSEPQALAAAALVKERGLGRTIVVSLESAMTAGVTHLPATTGSLADCVRADERLTVLVRALLGDTQVATDVASALELRRSGARVVSLEGHVFERDGVMITAGSRAVQGLISRKAELRQLEDEIGRYMGLVSEREARQAEIDRLLADAEAQLNQLRQEAYEKSVAKADFVRNAEQLGVREQFLLAERESKRKEIEAIGRQGRAIADREAVLAALRTELSAVKERIAAEIASLNATRERYNHAREELRTRHIAAREECAKAGEKRLAVERQLALLVASRDDVAKSLERAAGLLGETVARLEAATAEVARLEVEHDALGGQLTEARGRVEAAAKARERMAGEDESARAQRSRVESELAPCEQEQNAQRVEEASVRAQADGVIQRARDEAQLDLVSEAAAAPAEEAVDWEALRSETDELRVKINTFGIVNVAALEQMQELEETEKFARAQQEDLERSKAQLEELIRTLNKESRELFEKTFELVREQFNTIFRKIFGGGNADIILEQLEGVDPMEQGLEIKARPPGKELTPISMLSGGEKSLTAIALVMALFRANPGPFCLLDEADAALDEKNVERYAGLVREFASDTQFIVITHNKRTMAVCDALYGVTMEQRGVSKKVSVNLSGDGNLDLLKSRGAPVPSPSV